LKLWEITDTLEGGTACVEELVKKGISVDCRDNEMATPVI
jgi:hypothetical protein